jgi:hypothetical protein
MFFNKSFGMEIMRDVSADLEVVALALTAESIAAQVVEVLSPALIRIERTKF